ncbi:hypothetical protein QJQ45_026503, partial [Haematococcus lacustris]
SDEEQQQHFSGKRIAVAAEVFDAVAQLDDGLRDKSIRSYSTQLKHYVVDCAGIAIHVLTADRIDLTNCSDGARAKNPDAKVSALKQLHAALQKEYKKACHRAKITEMPDLLRIIVYNSAYKTLMKLVAVVTRSGSDSCWKWGKSFSHYNRGHRDSLSQPWCQKPEPWRLEQLQCVCQHSRSPQKACHEQAMAAWGQLPKATKDLYKQAAKHINDVQGRVRKATRVASKKYN